MEEPTFGLIAAQVVNVENELVRWEQLNLSQAYPNAFQRWEQEMIFNGFLSLLLRLKEEFYHFTDARIERFTRKKRVLIVEDEYVIAATSRLFVDRMGFEVVGMPVSGEEAVAMMHERPADLILMDIKLAGKIDGEMAMYRIRQISNCPVLYITGNTDAIAKLKMNDPEAGFLLKPISELALKQAIEGVLGQN